MNLEATGPTYHVNPAQPAARCLHGPFHCPAARVPAQGAGTLGNHAQPAARPGTGPVSLSAAAAGPSGPSCPATRPPLPYVAASRGS